MIVINILLIFALCSLEGGKFCEAAEAQEGRISQFLRRRIGSQVKRGSGMMPVDGAMSGKGEDSLKKSIEFNLRPRTKSNDKPISTFGSTVFGFFSSAVNEISRTLDAIDNLEMAYDEVEKSRRIQESKIMAPPPTLKHDPRRASVVNQLLKGAFAGFDNSDSDSNTNSSGDCPKNIKKSESSDFEGNIDENNDILDSEKNIVEESGRESTIISALEDGFLVESGIHDQPNEMKLESNIPGDLTIVSSLKSSNPDEIGPNYIFLSDSDSESWVKVEQNMIENVQVLVTTPNVAHFVGYFGSNRNRLVDFLSTVFVKFAKKIFFKPHPVVPKQRKVDSFEDFVSEFGEILSKDSDGGEMEPKILDFETAHRILFYNEVRDYSDDWEWCVVLPSQQDFVDAIDYLKKMNPEDMKTIEADLPRLALRFYDYYAESRGRGPLETDPAELSGKVRFILAFIMAFESKEVSTVNDNNKESSSSDNPISTFSVPSKDPPIRYLQGYHSIAAYFAINFELDCAGPLAYRFFQLYMSELIGAKSEDLREVVRKIDSRAVSIVRAYLIDQVNGAFVLNFEVLLGILEAYPFSDRSASILYTTSATTWADLDRLFQFLLLKVPQSQAHKSISLLAAANMLFSMLSLEKLFKEELLGSDQWNDLKEQLSLTTSKSQRRSILDSLVFEFMGQMFLALTDKIVHAGHEFNEFLKVTESLVPYLNKFQ